MKKRKKRGRTLSRTKDQKVALMRTMLFSLIDKKRITTTLAKAKELRPFAESFVTMAKKSAKGDQEKVFVMRTLKKDLPVVSVKELIKISDLFKDREGGYTRIIKTIPRKSDFADMAVIEWVEPVEKDVKKETPKKEEKDTKKEDKKSKKK